MKHYIFILSFLIFISCQKENNGSFADSLSELHGVEYKIVKENTLQRRLCCCKEPTNKLTRLMICQIIDQ